AFSLLSVALKQSNALDMLRHRKLINWLDRLRYMVAFIHELMNITNQGCRITADINDLLRIHSSGTVDQTVCKSFPRWVNYDYVRINSLTFPLSHPLFSIANFEIHIINVIKLGVRLRIRNCFRHDFHTVHLTGMLSKAQRNRPNSTISINNSLIAR